MSTVRILHIHFGTDGGAERFFVNLVKAFGRHGVEQQFAIRPDRKWKTELQRLGPIYENRGRPFSLSGLWFRWKLRRIIQAWKPHAVMAWKPRAAGFIPNLSGPVRFARLGDYPFNLKHFGKCDFLVGNNPDIGMHCQKMGWKKPIYTISNFPTVVPIQSIDRSHFSTPHDAFVIANAGRLVTTKGFDLLIRILAQIPDVHAWLIGDGPEKENLQQLARDCGVEPRCHFLGWVAEPIHYLHAANALVMPSRHEPLGNVILEAWQADTPVVSTRSEGPSWFMRHEANGLLVEIDDLDGLVRSVRRLQSDPELVAQLRQGGRKSLAEQFSEQAVVSQYLALIRGRAPLNTSADSESPRR